MSDHSLLSAVWKMNVFRSDKEEVSTVARVGLGQSDRCHLTSSLQKPLFYNYLINRIL